VATYSRPYRYTTKWHHKQNLPKIKQEIGLTGKTYKTTQKITQKEQPTQARLINLTNTKFTKEQMDTNYATEKEPKH
jgi:hypothetical protein